MPLQAQDVATDDPNNQIYTKPPAVDPEDITKGTKTNQIPGTINDKAPFGTPVTPGTTGTGGTGGAGGTSGATGYFSPPTVIPNANSAAGPGAIGAATAAGVGTLGAATSAGVGSLGSANAAYNAAGLSAPITASQGSLQSFGAVGAGASQGVTAGAATAGRVDAVNTTVDPLTGTVQGQLANIIDANSPLLQRAVARANQASNDRGLLNSTQNITAGQAALYDAAMPIASQDANAYNTTRLTNQAATNAASTANAQMYTAVSQSNVQAALQAGIVSVEQANEISKFNASSINDASKFNAASSNDMSKFNVQQLLQAGIINQDQFNRMSALNATQANASQQFNAGEQNRMTGLSAQLGADTSKFNAGEQNRMTGLSAQLNSDTSKFNAGEQNKMTGLTAQLSNDISKFNASQSNELIKLGMTSDTQKSLANIEANYRTLMQTSSSSSNLYAQTMGNLTQIMSNKDMTEEAKTTAQNNLMRMLHDSLSLQGKLGGMDLSSILTFTGAGSNYSNPNGNPNANPGVNPATNPAGNPAVNPATNLPFNPATYGMGGVGYDGAIGGGIPGFFGQSYRP